MTKMNQAVLSAGAAVIGITLMAKITGAAARIFIAFGLVFLTAAAATVDLSKRRPQISHN